MTKEEGKLCVHLGARQARAPLRCRRRNKGAIGYAGLLWRLSGAERAEVALVDRGRGIILVGGMVGAARVDAASLTLELGGAHHEC